MSRSSVRFRLGALEGIFLLYVGRIFEKVKNGPCWYIRESLGFRKIDRFDMARSNLSPDGRESQ